MYAFVSNEYRTIVHTRRQLDFLCGIYSYPKFKRVENMIEAREFFGQNSREFYMPSLNKFGKTEDIGYISIEYFIADNNIYVNVDTKHFGYIKLKNLPSHVKQESTYDLLRLKICNVVLDNSLIAHHCIAISHIISLFDDNINMELKLPDVSVYLACTKYEGRNFGIRNIANTLKSRLGVTFYTIKKV